MLKRIKSLMDANIDYGSAIVAAALLGGIVFWINHDHGNALATTAALKQGTYTFFVAGFIAKNNERLVLRWGEPWGLPAAVLVSSCIAVSLTFLVHSLKGTPEPLHSTLPTILMAPPGFAALGWRARKAAQATGKHPT